MRTFARLAAFAAPLISCAVLLVGCASGVNLDEPIEARHWQLVSLDLQPVAPAAHPDQRAQLVFDNGRVTGSGGCNRLSGSYQRNGSRLKLGPLATTRMACADAGRSGLETRFLAALQATASYRVKGARLLLLDASGRTLAELTAGDQ